MVSDTKLRVIACRPDYIGPNAEEAQIGQTMMEIAGRGYEFANSVRFGAWQIIRYSDAYEQK